MSHYSVTIDPVTFNDVNCASHLDVFLAEAVLPGERPTDPGSGDGFQRPGKRPNPYTIGGIAHFPDGAERRID